MNAHNPFDAKQDWTNPYCQNSSNDPMVDALLGNAYHVVRTVYCNLGNLKLIYDFLNQYGMVLGVQSEAELKALTTKAKYARIYGFSRAGDRQVTDYLYVEGDRTGIIPDDPKATGSWITVATSGSSGGGTSSGEGAYIPWIYSDGSATGGETTINVPDGTVGVPFIIVNGDMQYVGRGFEFNVDSLSVTLAQPLEEGDEVVFLLTGVPAVPDNPNVNDWVQINWLYNNGAAVGGEQVIVIPYTFQSIPAVYKNGLRLDKNLATNSYLIDTDNQSIILTEPLTTNDRVIIQIGGEARVVEVSDRTVQEIARSLNVSDSAVILSTNTASTLNGKKFLYSVEQQKVYELPLLPSNIYISAVSGQTLTYNPGEIQVTLKEVITGKVLQSRIEAPDGATLYPELQIARWRDEGDVRGWGAKGDGVTDSTENIAASLNSQKAVVASDGVFSSSGINSNYCNLDGRGSGVLSHRSSTGNYLVFNNLRSGRLSNITVESNKATDTTQGQQVSLAGGSDVTVSDVNFSNVKGTGFSLITYPNDAPSDGLMIKGIRGSYSGYATNKAAGCILADSSVNSLINNVIAKNYPQFGAVELKGTASYNIVSNVIGADCQHVTYNGTEGSIAPSNNLINGVVANNPKYAAVVAGKGSTNLISDVLVDFSTSDASQAHGVTVEGSDNVISNVLMSGCDGNNSLGETQTATIARFIGTANNNYASVFPSYSATGVITFESGSTRNFVEVKHPGRRNDLLSATSTIGGAATIDGTNNSNVVHAPALGQYIGSMSGRFEWRIKSMPLPSGVLTSADKYRMLGDGAVSLAVGGGTSSQVRLFTSDGTSRTVSLTNGNVRLSTSSTGYLQLGTDAITPNSTGTYALGSASQAWSGGFTQAAFTVTSDARCKTEPLTISDALLDAWSEVDFVQFQYLDRVEKKGADSARWHFGIIAQRAKEAFERHGIDAHRYGFLCFDSWDDVYEEDANGSHKLITPAGSRYGIRYEEVLILEAALMRRTIKRMQEALAVMSK